MPGYITRDKLSPMDLIYQIRLAGGVPVMFHPKSIKLSQEDTYDFISFLKLAGLEVYNSHHTEEQIEHFMKIANKLDLVPTVGSDYHALASNKEHPIEIGKGINNNLNISDYSIITKLKERHHEINKKK